MTVRCGNVSLDSFLWMKEIRGISGLSFSCELLYVGLFCSILLHVYPLRKISGENFSKWGWS